MFRFLIPASLIATLAIAPAFAAPNEFGQAAPAAQAKRTVTITMKDNEYEPKSVTVKAGEVVRFVLVNKGELLHEFAVGRPQDHAEHQKMMAMMLEHGMITTTSINHKMMKMDHGGGQMGGHSGSHSGGQMGGPMGGQAHQHGPEMGSVLVEPGKRAELTWKFPQAMTLQFACTIPGHYEAGMVGNFNFQ